jgi:phosphoribosylformylglycinamidine synthase I
LWFDEVLPMARIAILQFPGSNCEMETKRAAEAVGLEADLFRWNRPPELLAQYDAYIIGGGFSYQDRVRSGAIAVKEPIMREVARQAAAGKPVMGICNGCQILVEAGLIPGISPGEVEMGLAPNRMVRGGRVVRRNHYCAWTHLLQSAPRGRCVFTSQIEEGAILPIPISHGEGRFATKKEGLIEELIANDQVIFRYCTPEGVTDHEFPVNPNGSTYNIAGLCNREGNVFALMPHPERASWVHQIPYELGGPWAHEKDLAWGSHDRMRSPGPGRLIFESLRQALVN